MTNPLRANEMVVNDYIKIKIPTVGEIMDYGEQEYYGLLSSLSSTPYEMMAQLYLAGIDYEEITEYELFINMLINLAKGESNTSILFGDLDLSSFIPDRNKENGSWVLHDAKNNRTIDQSIHHLIASAIRKLLFSEKSDKVAGNKASKAYMIERAVKKYKRSARKPYVSMLDDLIIALVNCEQFKYNYEETMDLSLYKFNASVRQIPRKLIYDQLMAGVYAGTLKYKDLNPKDLNWLSQH